MRLSAEGRVRVAEVAARHGVSADTAERLAVGLAQTGGGQVQFSEPELGGMGQWSRGGMTMVGDMFNNALKARVDALCNDLSMLVSSGDLMAPEEVFGGQGWPAGLGRAGTSGSQNDMRYAVFPETRRLAVARGGRVTVYDTGEHHIGGVSQAQSGDQSLAFTSQFGPVHLSDLAIIDGDGRGADIGTSAPAPAARAPDALPPASSFAASAPAGAAPVRPAAAAPMPAAPAARAEPGLDDVLATIERLADLASRGILTDDEFARKKAELLDRL